MLARSTQQALFSRQNVCQKILSRSHHCEPSSPLFDWRRRKDRSNWCPVEREIAESGAYSIYGYHGYDAALNWTLAFQSVHPHHQAFRNLHNRGLSMFFEGTKDKNHALHTTIESKPIQTLYRIPTQEQLEEEWKGYNQRYADSIKVDESIQMKAGVTREMLDAYHKKRAEAVGEEKEAIEREKTEFMNRHFRTQEDGSYPLVDWMHVPTTNNVAAVSPKALSSFPRELRQFLSTFQDKIYVEDGLLGSDPRTELRVRLITNSPNMALAFSNMVFTPSAQVSSEDYRPPLTIIHSADFFENAAVSNYGVEGDRELCLIDYLKGNMFIAGRATEDVSVFRSLLAKAASNYLPSRSIIPLPAYVLSPSFSIPPIVVIHNPDSPLLESFFNEHGNKNVYANQLASWTDFGISALVSDLLTQPPRRGDVVQHIMRNNKEARVNHVVRRRGVPTVLPHPKKVVLVSTSGSSTAASPAELITEHWNQNLSSFPLRADKWAEAINQKIQNHQVQVERINLKSESVAELKKSLASVLA